MSKHPAVRSLPWLALPLCVAALAAAPKGDQTRLLRSPTVSATQIAFAHANNIWIVERGGGLAHRLTSFQGQTINPHFSPDGKWIAFSGDYAATRMCTSCHPKGGAETADVAPGGRHGAGLDARRHVGGVCLSARDVGAKRRTAFLDRAD